MESKSNREDNHNLNMREDGGDAIEVLDTETTRVDVTSPQERATSTDRSATAKAIMSAAPSTSGLPLDQEMLTHMWNKFHQMQEQALQKHFQVLKQTAQNNAQLLEQAQQMHAQNLLRLEQNRIQWQQQLQQLVQEETMRVSEDTEHTQHTPEHPGSGEIQLNDQLVQEVTPVEGRHQEGSQIKKWPVEALHVEGQPQEGPQVKLWPSKVLHVRDQHPDLTKVEKQSHQELQAQGQPNEALQVKEWPPEVPLARDQLLGRRNRDLKVNCMKNQRGQSAQTKNKVKKKKEEGRWSWPKNYLKNPYLQKKWPDLPQKFVETRFQKDYEGQRVCLQNTGKRTKWKVRNSQKQFCLFMHSVSVSLY